MDYLWQFADAGTAFIVVAALARSKDANGRSSYSEGRSLASFCEMIELEYGCDDGFILAPADGDKSIRCILSYVLSLFTDAILRSAICDRRD
jgi:hypothetical protein